jgi:hypothetical protein
VQDGIPARRGEREGTLATGDGLVVCALGIEMEGQKERDLAQPPWVIEGRREGLGLTQIHQNTPKIAERIERRAQRKPEVDGLYAGVVLLRQRGEGTECLREVSSGLAEG